MLCQKCHIDRGCKRSPHRAQLLSSPAIYPGTASCRFQLHRRVLDPTMATMKSASSNYPGSIVEAFSIPGPLEADSLVFYSHVLCPFAERVWLTLLEKNVPHTLVHVDLSAKPTWYKRLNPRGLVPCVAYKSEVIIESEDICRSHPHLCTLHSHVCSFTMTSSSQLPLYSCNSNYHKSPCTFQVH